MILGAVNLSLGHDFWGVNWFWRVGSSQMKHATKMILKHQNSIYMWMVPKKKDFEKWFSDTYSPKKKTFTKVGVIKLSWLFNVAGLRTTPFVRQEADRIRFNKSILVGSWKCWGRSHIRCHKLWEAQKVGWNMIFTNYKILHDKPRKKTPLRNWKLTKNILNPKMDFEDINPKLKC